MGVNTPPHSMPALRPLHMVPGPLNPPVSALRPSCEVWEGSVIPVDIPPPPPKHSGSPRWGKLASDLVGSLQQGVVDVLGTSDLGLDEGQVLGVGEGLACPPLAFGGCRHQGGGVLGAVKALREALVGQALGGNTKGGHWGWGAQQRGQDWGGRDGTRG